MRKINFNINLTALKITGILVVLVGCFGFIYGITNKVYVMESVSVIGMGLGVLGYRKSITTKNGSIDDRKVKE